jgi:hypothetical protein
VWWVSLLVVELVVSEEGGDRKKKQTAPTSLMTWMVDDTK